MILAVLGLDAGKLPCLLSDGTFRRGYLLAQRGSLDLPFATLSTLILKRYSPDLTSQDSFHAQ